MWETAKNFDEYLSDIKQQSKLVVNDCKQMGKLHHFELIGLIATTVAQYELRIFNHFLKKNDLVTQTLGEYSNSIRIPHQIFWIDVFEKLEEVDENRIRRIQSNETIHVDKLTELLNDGAKEKVKAKDVMKNLLDDRWNRYITRIIDILNRDEALDWFKEAREMRHQLVHSLEKDAGNPFDSMHSNNKTKQAKTILNAKTIMKLAFGVDNFSLANMNFTKPFTFPLNMDEDVPCHLSRYIEANKGVFGLIANYNDFAKDDQLKMLFAWVVGKDDIQYGRIPHTMPFADVEFIGGKRVFFSFESLTNKKYYDESIYAQMWYSDPFILEKCGVKVRP